MVGEQDKVPLSYSFPGLFHVSAHVRALSCCQGLIEQKEESKENHHYGRGQGRKGWQLGKFGGSEHCRVVEGGKQTQGKLQTRNLNSFSQCRLW